MCAPHAGDVTLDGMAAAGAEFFAVFPVKALEDAPHTWVLLARAPDGPARARVQRDVVRAFPNVAILDLTQVQAALDDVLGRVAAVIRFLAGFSVATGFIVLLGAVLTGRLQRIRESVLLRTLGATRRQIAAPGWTSTCRSASASIAGSGWRRRPGGRWRSGSSRWASAFPSPRCWCCCWR